MHKSNKWNAGLSSVQVIGILALVILLLGGLYYFLGRNGSEESIATETTGTEDRRAGTTDLDEATTNEMTTTIEDVISMSQSQECDFRVPVENTESAIFENGKLWTSNNRGRSNLTANVSGMSVITNAIYKDGGLYTWVNFNGNTTGFMYTEEELANLDSGLSEEQMQQAEQIRQEMIFNCRPWIVDESKFELPSDVNFESGTL